MSDFIRFFNQHLGTLFLSWAFALLLVYLFLRVGFFGKVVSGDETQEDGEAELSEARRAGREARDRDHADCGCPDWTLPEIEDHDPPTQARIRAWTAGWHERDSELFRESSARIEAAGTIIRILCKYADRADLKNLGQSIAICESQEGFPAEMSFTHVEENTKLMPEEKAVVIFWYTAEAMKHRRNSDLGWKRYRQLQQRNTEIDLEVLRTGKFSSVFHMLT